MASFLVTGANRGIGLSLCKLLAARGDEVAAVCRRGSRELSALSGVRIEEGLDLAHDGVSAELTKRFAGAHFDGLILNAGILRADSLTSLSVASVREQLEVNALGPLRVVSGLLHSLGRGSKIALVTSRMGSIADNTSGGYYGYRMSKAALNAAGMSLALDLKPKGIAVTTLHPGYVRTEMTANSGNVEPDDSARMILARMDELTLETTGQFLHANGERLPW
jgi:NAD(P)-dependent dehydrogenase (short-subunit alcohol dehydrogenase family)